LADYLDATGGRELKSLEGAFGLMGYIEDITPRAKDYSGFVIARSQLEMEFGLKPKPSAIVLQGK